MRSSPDMFDALAAAESREKPTMSLWEKRNVFRTMVADTCRNGSLSKRRRWQLVQYAAKLGLHPIQAGRLIDDARAAAAVASPQPTLTLSHIADRPPASRRDWEMETRVVLVSILLNTWVLLAILL